MPTPCDDSRLVPLDKPCNRPPLTLILGPANSGKTEWAISRFLAEPVRPLLLVLSPQQAASQIEQITTRTNLPEDEVKPYIQPFRSLASLLHKSAPEPGYRIIGSTFQRLILSELVPRTLRPDDFLGRMRDAPGFVTALAERIREWKLTGITPDSLDAGGQAAFCAEEELSSRIKTHELSRLFRAYELFLAQYRLRDAEDMLRLAAERYPSGEVSLPGNSSLILVDGFYWFNRTQRALLAALSQGIRPCEVAVTLPYEENRPLLFAAPERALQAFRQEFETCERVLPPRTQARPAPLTHLERQLFSPAMDLAAGDSTTAKDRSLPIAETERHTAQVFDAPNPYVEAEMVARTFRRLYDSGGYSWNDFGIILRMFGDYAPILSAVFERYAIPFGVDGPEKLTENPLLKTILHLLAIFRYGWRRDEVLAFLKSSYTAPARLEADLLRRRAAARGVRSGRDQWLTLLEQSPDTPHSVASTLQTVADWEERVTAPNLLPLERAEALRECVKALGLENRIGAETGTRAECDRAAWQTATEVLDALTEMSSFSAGVNQDFAEFHERLLAVWNNTSSLATPDGEMVRVTEPYDARERPLRVVAVMGLTERVFPRRITEDPFLRDVERQALRDHAGLELELQKNRTDDERFLFYLAVTAPSERLILSFPRSADESDTLPSFYLDEIRAALPDIEVVPRTLADVAPRPEETVTESDRLLAACADLFDPGSELDSAQRQEKERKAAALMTQCLSASETQARLIRSLVASRREPKLPQLHDTTLREDFAEYKRVFSVTELETYRRCPFQYLLRSVLRLRPEEDDATPRAQGTLLHAVLRRYFRTLAEQRALLPDAEKMRADLHALMSETLEKAQLDATPHRLRMTRRLLTDALHGFADRETRFTEQFRMTPAHFELAFGQKHAEEAVLEDEEQDSDLLQGEGPNLAESDPASVSEPLMLYGKDGGSAVAVCGTIDRVDFDLNQKCALVLDYKLGKPPDYSEIQRGHSLQMPLYLLAIERLWGKVGAVACYDSMRESGRRRFHRTEHVNIRQFAPMVPFENGQTIKPVNREEYERLTSTAEATAVQIARSIATGRVEATPGDHCKTCAYKDVCRTTLINGHDGEPAGYEAQNMPR